MATPRHRRRKRRANATRSKKRSVRRGARKAPAKSNGFIKKRRRGISDARLQRGLSVLRELKDLFAAARAARTTPKRFAAAALKKGAIRKQGKRWVVARDLPRRMLVFSAGRELIIAVPNAAAATVVGQYMAAIRQFLRTNNPDRLTPFRDRSVKDTAGKLHPFETSPNAIYRLASAGDQTFEQIYRIVV